MFNTQAMEQKGYVLMAFMPKHVHYNEKCPCNERVKDQNKQYKIYFTLPQINFIFDQTFCVIKPIRCKECGGMTFFEKKKQTIFSGECPSKLIFPHNKILDYYEALMGQQQIPD